MRSRQEDDRDHDEQRWERQSHRKASAVAWTKIIQHADQENADDSADHNVVLGNAQVAQRSPSAQRRGDSEIGDQQQSSHDRQQDGPVPSPQSTRRLPPETHGKRPCS